MRKGRKMSIRRNVAAISALLLALGLGACGNAASTGTAGKAAGSAKSSASAKQATPMTREQAAKYYEDLAKPFNDALDAFQLEYYSHDGVAASDAAAKVARAARNAAAKMNRVTWPRNAAKYAKATAMDFAADAVDYGKYAQCTTINEMDAIQTTSSSEHPSVGLRKALGLGSAPGYNYFTVTDSRSDGVDDTGYAKGAFTIRNGLKSTVYHMTATLSVIDDNGNSVSETYPQAQSPIPPGGTWAADYIISPDELVKGTRIRITGVSWGVDDSMSESYQLAMSSDPLNLR